MVWNYRHAICRGEWYSPRRPRSRNGNRSRRLARLTKTKQTPEGLFLIWFFILDIT